VRLRAGGLLVPPPQVKRLYGPAARDKRHTGPAPATAPVLPVRPGGGKSCPAETVGPSDSACPLFSIPANIL